MRTALAMVSALMLIGAFVPSASASHTLEKEYAISGGVGLTVSCGDCANAILGFAGAPEGAPVVNLGGATFNHTNVDGEVPSSVAIADATGGPVPFTVCQDLDANGICGDNETEPSLSACATSADLSGEDRWDASEDVLVFVSTADLGVEVNTSDPTQSTVGEPCGGAGTTGTISLTFAAP